VRDCNHCVKCLSTGNCVETRRFGKLAFDKQTVYIYPIDSSGECSYWDPGEATIYQNMKLHNILTRNQEAKLALGLLLGGCKKCQFGENEFEYCSNKFHVRDVNKARLRILPENSVITDEIFKDGVHWDNQECCHHWKERE